MKFRIIYLTILVTALFYFNGCGDKTKPEQTEQKEEEHHDEEVKEVPLSDEQIKAMDVKTEKLDYRNISGYIKVSGEIKMNQDQESKVGSIIPGRVKKIYVREGSYVRAGQTLATIENLDLVNAQVEYLEAKHEYEHVKIEYERQLTLSSDNIGSRKELAKLKADYEHTVIGMKSAEQKLLSYKISTSKLDNYEDINEHNDLQKYYVITAPISGNVVSRMVTVGQYIETSNDMFHIVNISTVYADLNVFEKDLQYVSAGQKVSLEVSVSPFQVYEGEITNISKMFDDKNRTVTVRVAINNKNEKLLPFMFVSAKIYVKQESVLAVPLSALESDGDVKYIFVRCHAIADIKDEHHDEHNNKEGEHKEDEHKEDEHKEDPKKGFSFKKVLVNTGISDDKYVQIFPIDELKPDEIVVTKGTFYLKSELKKGELEEHHH